MHRTDADHGPPANTPWVVSSAKDVHASLESLMKWKHKWACTYPGVKSSHCEKNLWAQTIEREASDIRDVLLQCNLSNDNDPQIRPHEPSIILRNIIYETNTNELDVQLIVARSVVQDFGLKHFGACNIYTSCISTEEEQKHTHKLPDFALLAQVFKLKNARTQDVVDELLQMVGLSVSSYVRCAPARGGLEAEADINFHLPEFLGGTISFYDPKQDRNVVAFELLKKGVPESPLEYQCRLHARNWAGFRLGYMFVRRDPYNNNYNNSLDLYHVSEDTHMVLWFREEQEVDRARRHLRWGDGESESVKERLDGDGADSADLRLEMIAREFEYLKSIDKGHSIWARKFSILLAITLEIANDPKFISQVSDAQAALDTLKDIASFWKSVLNNKHVSPVDLGLGTPNAQDTVQPSLEALTGLLRSVKDDLESIRVETSERRDDGDMEGDTNMDMEKKVIQVKFGCLPRKALANTRRKWGESNKNRKDKRGSSEGIQKPLGRVPTDKLGEKMEWCTMEGVWRSVNDKNEIKTAKRRWAAPL